MPDYWDGDIPWAAPSDLSKLIGSSIEDTSRKLTTEGLASCGASLLPTNSVLMSSRASIGLAAVNKVPMATNQGFKSLIPKAGVIDHQFLYWWIVTHRAAIERLGRGATFKEISKAVTAAIKIALPPIDEQRRIAAILDKADEVRAKRMAALESLESLTLAVFMEMFGDPNQSPVEIGDKLDDHLQGWRWELLTDVARLATGHTPDRERPDFWDGDIPWISLTEIRRLDGRIASHTDLTVTPAGIAHSSSVVLPPGTVCFSRTASIGFVTVMGTEMATSQDFVNWVCGDRLDPVFLMTALLVSRNRLRSLSTGSTHKTIYLRVAEKFRVLVPPMELQRRFTELAKAAWTCHESQVRSTSLGDDLFRSLQQRAFKGAL